MKTSFVSIVAAIALTWIGYAGAAHAVHDGSVGECDHCHKIHGGNPFLLTGRDPGSTCLRCHAYYRMSPTVPIGAQNGALPLQATPAGDFGWLDLDYKWPDSKQTPVPYIISSRSERHGHSIVAVEFGFLADTVNQVAPGGTYPASQLTCISCHDPHNRYRRIDNAGTKMPSGAPIVGSGSDGRPATPGAPVGVYRLLAGPGYTSYGGSSFIYPPPDAVALGDDIHVAYGQGMSEWCANCHPRFLHGLYISGAPGQMHPAGKTAHLTPEVVRNYGRDLRFSNLLTAYTPLAPVEEGIVDYDGLKLHAAAGGTLYRIDTVANVMCLTCHRAHASPWNSAIRWPYGLFEKSGKGFTKIETESEHIRQAFPDGRGGYDRFRGVLCNKCHGKDN